MLPFTEERGSIQLVRVDIDGFTVQPYLIGNLYDDLFSAVILIANHSDKKYKVPIGAITLQAEPIFNSESHSPRSRKIDRKSPKDVITEKCLLSDWETAVSAETDDEQIDGEVERSSNSHDMKLLVGGLFTQAETYELSWKESQSVSDNPGSEQATAFYVEARQCVRVMASFDDLIEDGEGGLLEIVVVDTDTKRLHKVVFVLTQTMSAQRLVY